MPTHAVIARGLALPHTSEAIDPLMWEGRYIHYDGFPTGAGRLIWRAAMGFRSVDTLICRLIEDHPAGWAGLGTSDEPPACYCHDFTGARTDKEAQTVDAPMALRLGCEWAYVLFPFAELLLLYRAMLGTRPMTGCPVSEDTPNWKLACTLSFRGREPAWERIESGTFHSHNFR